MSEQLDSQLKNIQEKLQQLLKVHFVMQKENAQLKKELEKSKLLVDDQATQLQQLQQKVEVLKVGLDSWSEEDKMMLSKRITAYLKEIDQCISLLNTA